MSGQRSSRVGRPLTSDVFGGDFEAATTGLDSLDEEIARAVNRAF